MRSSKRIISWLIGTLLALNACPTFADGLFLKIEGQAQGHVGYLGLTWNERLQSIAAHGYKGDTLATSKRDKNLGTQTVSEMSAFSSAETVYRIHGPFGIVVSTVKSQLQMPNVVHHPRFDEGDLTVSAAGKGRATMHLTHHRDQTLRTIY